MDSKKQASIADALAAKMSHEIPILEGQVPSFIRSMIPPVPADKLKLAAAELAATAAEASDKWDAAHPQVPQVVASEKPTP